MVKGVSGVRADLFSLLLFLTITCLFALVPGGALAQNEILTSETIESSGLTRLADILMLVDDWSICTTDGFTWQASPNGLFPFEGQTWQVMLDGQRIDLKLFDVNNLNLLPVALDFVDSVEIVSLPRNYNGEFIGRGLIHIHTRRPANGFFFRGSVIGGNETGDPGPYRYTGDYSPNVDAIGPDASLSFGFGSKDRYIRANIASKVHFFRDAAMFKRNEEILRVPAETGPSSGTIAEGDHECSSFIGRLGFDDLRPGMRQISSLLAGGLELFGGKHELLAGYSDASRYFLFFKPFGREIPVDHRFGHAGITGCFPVSSKAHVVYRLKYSVNRLDEHPNALDVDFDWQTHNLSSGIEGHFGEYSRTAIVGARLDRVALHTNYHLTNSSYNAIHSYGVLSFKSFDTVRHDCGISVVFSGGREALKAFLSNDWRINSGNSLKTHLSFSHRLQEEDNSLWYWAGRGYGLLNDFNIDYTAPGNIDKATQLTADATWQTNASHHLKIETTFSYRFFKDLHLEKYIFELDSLHCSFVSPVRLCTGADGHYVKGRLSAQHRITHRLSHRLFYSYQTEVAGDAAFKDTWKAVPRHKVSYRFTYAPVMNFRIWGMLSYLSSSMWTDYLNIDGASCVSNRFSVTYQSTVRSSTVLDLQIQKWLWQRKIRGDFLCRNVWNEDFRYYPIGAAFDLSFYIQLKVFSDSQPPPFQERSSQ